MNIDCLDTLVFSGGGVRGFSYVGALMAFQDTYKKSMGAHFKVFAGASVGALFAFICCMDLDLDSCLKAFETVGLDEIFNKDPTCLLSNYALNSGSSLEALVIKLLSLGSFTAQTTVKELYIKTQKKLIVTTIDLLTADTLHLDHQNIGADMPVLKAIMGSMALPPLFPPVNYSKDKSKILMTDGGMLRNSPFIIFDPLKTLKVSTTWYIDKSPIKDIASYYTRIVHIMLLGSHEVQEKEGMAYENSILIDLGVINADDTSINIKEIIFVGYRAGISRFTSAKNMNLNYDPSKYIKN